jgi:hypothetical protein
VKKAWEVPFGNDALSEHPAALETEDVPTSGYKEAKLNIAKYRQK